MGKKKPTKKHAGGRPKKAVKEINPVVWLNRHPQAEIDLLLAAAAANGQTLNEWAWPILLKAARR